VGTQALLHRLAGRWARQLKHLWNPQWYTSSPSSAACSRRTGKLLTTSRISGAGRIVRMEPATPLHAAAQWRRFSATRGGPVPGNSCVQANPNPSPDSAQNNGSLTRGARHSCLKRSSSSGGCGRLLHDGTEPAHPLIGGRRHPPARVAVDACAVHVQVSLHVLNPPPSHAASAVRRSHHHEARHRRSPSGWTTERQRPHSMAASHTSSLAWLHHRSRR
jgi:hypothetical protein